MRRPGRLAAVSAAAALMLLSACQPGSSQGPSGGAASSPGEPSASVSGARGSGPSQGSWSTPSSTPAADPPVASFDPAAHAVFTDHRSPDRQRPTATRARPSGFADPPLGSGAGRYLHERIAWTACGKFSCGSVRVPLDWDRPDGPAITLRMKKAAATGKHLGTMFINPGGPGSSGQDMLSDFDVSKFPGYDVIGWDPRGSGASTPVRCGTDAQTDAYFGLDSSPDDQKEWSELEAGTKAFTQQCRAASGPLLDHISTIDTARDLDLLRYLVGDSRLNYLGISYGTFIGATYAEMYPGRVGRMVLDSAVNITDDQSVTQTMGFDKAFRSFAGWCAAAGDQCPLGASADAVVKNVTGWLSRMDSRPVTVGSRTLTQSLAATGIAFYLYSGAKSYRYLGASIAWAQRGKGEYLLSAADYLNGRDPESGDWESSAYAFPAINCLDSADDGLAGVRRQWGDDVRRAPVLGPALGASAVCAYWTARPVEQMRLTASGAAPILVLGVTGDPATPYVQAQWMARQLNSGVLVTWRGAGHSAWSLGNSCVRGAVTGYMDSGTVPRSGLTC